MKFMKIDHCMHTLKQSIYDVCYSTAAVGHSAKQYISVLYIPSYLHHSAMLQQKMLPVSLKPDLPQVKRTFNLD